MKIKSFECKSIRNYEKKMLGRSDAWSMSCLSHWPSDPAHYIEDYQISEKQSRHQLLIGYCPNVLALPVSSSRIPEDTKWRVYLTSWLKRGLPEIQFIMAAECHVVPLVNLNYKSEIYILDTARSSGILKAKQKLGRTFNSDKLGGIAFTKIS